MPTPRAPTKRYEQRKRAILASAVEVLNRKGVRGMTLGDVAAALNLVPTGVIYYYKSKEELASACFLDGIAEFNRMSAAAEGASTAREGLARFVRAYFDFRRREATGEAEAIAMFNDVRGLNAPLVNGAYVDMYRGVRGVLAGPETRGLSRGEWNVRGYLLLSEAGWTSIWLQGLHPEDYARAGERMLSILSDGLGAPGVAWSPKPLPHLPSEPAGAAEISQETFLRAATELMNEEGYVGASVEKISARLNVTKGALYHHNETKDDLIVACFDRTAEVMRRAIRQAEAVSDSGYQTLATLAAGLVTHQMSGGAPLLRASAVSSAPEAMQPRLLAQFAGISSRIASILCDGIADGSVRPVDVNIAGQMITGMINASAELRFFAPELSAERAVAIYVRPLFEGLLSPPTTLAA